MGLFASRMCRAGLWDVLGIRAFSPRVRDSLFPRSRTPNPGLQECRFRAGPFVPSFFRAQITKRTISSCLQVVCRGFPSGTWAARHFGGMPIGVCCSAQVLRLTFCVGGEWQGVGACSRVAMKALRLHIRIEALSPRHPFQKPPL